MSWFINDLETQNHEYYGTLASPHDPRNYIVATGWCVDGGAIMHEYFETQEQALKSKWLAEGLKTAKFYVAHNLTFELQWLLKCYPDVVLDYIKRGGKFFCTQYAEYFLTHQQEMYARLEDCSVKYRGNLEEHEVLKLDEVKILWNQGVLTADIDKELLLSYLTDPVHGDIANTRRVCFAQVKQLLDNNMWKMFMVRMDSLVFNAISTFNGLHVDLSIAEHNLERQLKEIDELNAKIMSSLPKDLPPELEFKATSDYHLSALLFGGSINYDKKVSYEPKKYEKVDAYFIDAENADGSPFEMYVPVDEATEHHKELCVRYKSGKNKGQPKVFSIDSDVEKLKWGTGTYTFKGLIDLESLPDLVKEQYLGKRAEFRGKRNLPCGTPVYSTSGDSLAVLAKYTDVAKPMNRLGTVVKDTGTYYRMEKAGKITGMLQYVEPNSIIHHQLNNCATVTSRLSSSNPNFQNLPRGDGDESKGDFKSRVKEMFTSRFGKDGKIVEVDYTALEVVTLASISGDKNLLEQLIKGTDMHCYRLAFKEGLPYDEVYERCHNKDHPDHLEWKKKRSEIKTPSFADQYGASAAGVAYAAGCSIEFAQEFQDNEAKLFPEAKAYPKTVIRPMVEETGYSLKPHREFIDGVGWSLYRRGYYQGKSGTCYSFRTYEKRVDGQTVQDFKDTQVANYPFQGEAAFIVQAACGRVIRELVKRNFFDGQVLPINTVHDAIYLDCATEALAIEAGQLVRDIMASTPKWLTEQIPELKEWNYNTTPFPAAAEYGSSMAEKNHIE